MRRGFYCYSILKIIYALFVTITEISCTNLVDIQPIYGYMALIPSLVTIFVKIIVAIVLFHVMYKYANYEFKRIFPTMICYFIIDLIAYSLAIAVFTIEYLGEQNFDGFYNKKFVKILRILYLTNVPQILVGYSIIRFKDYHDPI